MKPAATVSITKGGGLFEPAEQVYISPQPKLGGNAGPILRFLSISRRQSVITDLEQGSLARKHRIVGMPLMHRMWFHYQGYSLGYTKKQKIGNPSELYFLGPDARLRGALDLPDAVSEVGSGVDRWYVGCRNGQLFSFSLEGEQLWRQVIPCRPLESLSVAGLALQYTQPYLHVRGGLGGVVIAEADRFYAFDSFGRRTLRSTVPQINSACKSTTTGEIPTREETLRRLGFRGDPDEHQVRTGYLRLAMDTNWDAGWLKQEAVYDIPDTMAESHAEPASAEEEESTWFQMFGRGEWITALAASPSRIAVGTQSGLVHVFDVNGSLEKTFHVGESNVTQVLMDNDELVAAYSGGRMTLFRGEEIAGSINLSEYFVELVCCGEHVLAWRYQSAWVVDCNGRVVWAGAATRPIKSAWADSSGFYLLAGEVVSLRQARPPAHRIRARVTCPKRARSARPITVPASISPSNLIASAISLVILGILPTLGRSSPTISPHPDVAARRALGCASSRVRMALLVLNYRGRRDGGSRRSFTTCRLRMIGRLLTSSPFCPRNRVIGYSGGHNDAGTGILDRS